MDAQGYQAIIGFLSIAIFFFSVEVIFRRSTKETKKTKGVPNIPNKPSILSAPYQRYIPTSERQYGRDLLEIATRIYLEKTSPLPISSAEKSKESIRAASEFIFEFSKTCVKIDHELFEKRAKEDEKMFKEFKK